MSTLAEVATDTADAVVDAEITTMKADAAVATKVAAAVINRI